MSKGNRSKNVIKSTKQFYSRLKYAHEKKVYFYHYYDKGNKRVNDRIVIPYHLLDRKSINQNKRSTKKWRSPIYLIDFFRSIRMKSIVFDHDNCLFKIITRIQRHSATRA